MNGYVAPYRGMGSSPLPANFLEIASSAGAQIGNGMASMANRITQALERKKEEHKQEGAEAKLYENLFKMRPELAPVQLEEFKNLSAKDKVAMGRGVSKKLLLDEQQSAVDARKASSNYMAKQGQVLDRSMVDADRRIQEAQDLQLRQGKFNQALANRLDEQYGPVPPLRSGELLKLMADNNVAGTAGSDSLLEQVIRGQPKPKTSVETVDVGGRKFGVFPPGAMVVPVSEEDHIEGIPVTGEDGNVMGHVIRDPKGGLKLMKPPKDDELTGRDVLSWENAFAKLDDAIAQQETAIARKLPGASPEKLKSLQVRRARMEEGYGRRFGAQSAPPAPGGADPSTAKPGAVAPAESPKGKGVIRQFDPKRGLMPLGY